MPAVIAQIFAGLIVVVILFQVALSLGAPWGHLAMGGRFPGKFPLRMRIAALGQAWLLVVLALVVLVRGHVILSSLYAASVIGIWVVVIILSLSLIMNLITPSRWERIIWAPVVIVLASCSLFVALS